MEEIDGILNGIESKSISYVNISASLSNIANAQDVLSFLSEKVNSLSVSSSEVTEVAAKSVAKKGVLGGIIGVMVSPVAGIVSGVIAGVMSGISDAAENSTEVLNEKIEEMQNAIEEKTSPLTENAQNNKRQVYFSSQFQCSFLQKRIETDFFYSEFG